MKWFVVIVYQACIDWNILPCKVGELRKIKIYIQYMPNSRHLINGSYFFLLISFRMLLAEGNWNQTKNGLNDKTYPLLFLPLLLFLFNKKFRSWVIKSEEAQYFARLSYLVCLGSLDFLSLEIVAFHQFWKITSHYFCSFFFLFWDINWLKLKFLEFESILKLIEVKISHNMFCISCYFYILIILSLRDAF